MRLKSNTKPKMTCLRPNMQLFALGQVVATPGAIDLIEEKGLEPGYFIARHSHGDFGNLDSDDVDSNWKAIMNRGRVFSSYRIDAHSKLWIITEADRSITTLLLPDEY